MGGAVAQKNMPSEAGHRAMDRIEPVAMETGDSKAAGHHKDA